MRFKKSVWVIFIFLNALFFLQAQDFFDAQKYEARELFNQGMGYYNAKSYEAAIKKFFESIRVRSSDNLVRYYLGMAFYKAGYTENAIEQWENVIKLSDGKDIDLVEKINHIFFLRGGLLRSRDLQKDYVFLKDIPLRDNDVFKGNLLGMPTGVWVDKDNEVYVVDFLKNALVKMDVNGNYVETIFPSRLANLTSVNNKLNRPYDLAYDEKSKTFYLSDFGNDRVLGIKKNGKISAIYKQDSASHEGYILGPQGIVVDGKGNLFISDTGNCKIHYYNKEGEYLYSFSSRGSEDGQLLFPSGIGYDERRDLIYVCDRGNDRISVFYPSGEFVRHIGEGFLKKPRKIVMDKNHLDVMTILDSNGVHRYKDGKLVSLFHQNKMPEDKNLLSVAYDDMGFMYLGSSNKKTIHVYSPLKLLYVNLFVQIENVYLREFPKVLLTVSIKSKEGNVLSKLAPSNFEVKENGVRKPFKFNVKPKKYKSMRPIILFESSLESESRKVLSRSLLEDLLESFDKKDKVRVYRFGGGTPKPSVQKNYYMADDYDNSIFRKIKRTLDGKYYKDFYLGTVLKRAITESIKVNEKKGIILICFQPYNEENFAPENRNVLVDFAKHNGIAIYVIYAGETDLNGNPKGGNGRLKNLCLETGGELIV